jgi:2-polyprenyl-3-methyl-5-hydroxy-6-metoxy-1,4-benzoquinol methylase
MKIEKGLYTYNFDYLMHKWIFETLEPHFRDGKTLEIGCFQGRMSSVLFDRFQNLFIVEPEIRNIEIAKTVVPDAVFNNCKIEDYEASILFQNIFLMHTLEHIEADVDALTMINSLLDEKGRLFVVVPNANAASRQIAVAGGIISSKKGVTDSEREHGHYRTYDLVDLKQSVHASGFKIIAEGGIFFKGLANFQLDLALESGIIGPDYLKGCVELGKILPDFCSSIYVVCERG